MCSNNKETSGAMKREQLSCQKASLTFSHSPWLLACVAQVPIYYSHYTSQTGRNMLERRESGLKRKLHVCLWFAAFGKAISDPTYLFYYLSSNFPHAKDHGFLLPKADACHTVYAAESQSPGHTELSQIRSPPRWWQAETASDEAYFSPLCRSTAAVPHVSSCHLLWNTPPEPLNIASGH